jgi:pyrimidine-nucleoside phosphorylase
VHFTRLIETKRDGHPLPEGAWAGAISDYLAERVPDYQMAALLMAVVWRGMGPAELAELTRAMLESGDRLAPATPGRPRVDKHSTGGVGDKTSLILAPLVASCGVEVPMMSGRGLGHTGGTTDKLEAIPGFRTALTLGEVEAQLQRIGVAMFGQTERIVPADRRLYALRDVTGTVPSIPLIAASIMSKKLAERLTGLVLDVKVGRGAFMTEPAQALELARTMVDIGTAHGCATVALVTAMDRPLGRAIGNALEVEEALLALEGQGPADLLQVTGALGVEMLRLAGVAESAAEAERLVADGLMAGSARDKFADLIEAQGGNPAIVDDPAALPQAQEVELFEAPVAGTVQGVDPRVLGQAVIAMGGGRQRLGDPIDHSVGFVVSARPGATVQKDEPIASVFAADRAGIAAGLAALGAAIRIGPPVPVPPLILYRVSADGVEPLAG